MKVRVCGLYVFLYVEPWLYIIYIHVHVHVYTHSQMDTVC